MATLASVPLTSALARAPRSPADVAWVEDPPQLVVATEAGEVLAIDEELRLRGAIQVGRAAAGLGVGEGGEVALALIDPPAIALLDVSGRAPVVAAQVPFAGTPSRLAFVDDALFVSDRDARSLTRFDFEPAAGAPLSSPRSCALPFPPGALLAVPEHGLVIAAGAHSGRIAAVDADEMRLIGDWPLAGHHPRDLALTRDGQHVLVAHQQLQSLASTRSEDVRWGLLITHVVRSLATIDLAAGAAELRDDVHYLGGFGRGAADPSAVVETEERELLVALRGLGELAIISPRGPERRVTVGGLPTVLALHHEGRYAFVCGDAPASIVRVELSSGAIKEIEWDDRSADDLARRGERLFHDARLSRDGWMSCGSCHGDGHAPGAVADTLADGTHGTPKTVPALFGVRDTAPYGWSGALPTLEAQVESTLRTTMHAPRVEAEDVEAIVAYLKSLAPPPPQRGLDRRAVARGEALFFELDCVRCHAPPAFTTPDAYDIGLVDARGLRRFNPPSLLGVGARERLLHDGRARSLDELLKRFPHGGAEGLAEGDRTDLIAFLRSL